MSHSTPQRIHLRGVAYELHEPYTCTCGVCRRERPPQHCDGLQVLVLRTLGDDESEQDDGSGHYHVFNRHLTIERAKVGRPELVREKTH